MCTGGRSGVKRKVSGGYRLEGKATIKYLPFDKSRLTCTVSSPLQDLVRWNAIVGELVRRGHPREQRKPRLPSGKRRHL